MRTQWRMIMMNSPPSAGRLLLQVQSGKQKSDRPNPADRALSLSLSLSLFQLKLLKGCLHAHPTCGVGQGAIDAFGRGGVRSIARRRAVLCAHLPHRPRSLPLTPWLVVSPWRHHKLNTQKNSKIQQFGELEMSSRNHL